MTLIPELETQLREAAERQRAKPARSGRRRRVAALAAGAVLVAGTAAAVVGTRDSTDPRIRPYLSILRRPVTAADALPPVVGRSGRFPFEVKEARRVRVLVPGWKAWIVPASGSGDACLFVQPPDAIGPGGAPCFSDTSIRKGASAATGTVAGGGVMANGIVPDGVPSITLVHVDGTKRTVPVRDNVYLALSAKPTLAVSYRTPDGRRVTVRAWSPGYVPPVPQPSAAERRESERARRHPSAPVRVTAGPEFQARSGARTNVGTRREDYFVTFRARIDRGAYAFRLRGPGGAGCRSRLDLIVRTERAPDSRRGRIYSTFLRPPDGRGPVHNTDGPTPGKWCPGRYRVDVSFVDRGRRFPAFGSARFVVR
ncbi:MAG: hypothetical protein QOJ57_424 [Thermoleophilaceae bacterium]|nr:hypothetical protein [Thermoleophilaceae bacterium]